MIRRAFTFVEFLVVIAMTAIILTALSGAYASAMDYVRRSPERLDAFQAETKIRRSLQRLTNQAYLSPEIDDLNSYFVATSASGSGTTVDTLVFTTLTSPEGGFLRDEESDYETLAERFGPQGGITEVSLSTIAVGDEFEGEGLFVREQRPADGDITQGGQEYLLVPDARDVTFDFWDGLDWVTEWDTRANQRRLPAAVRISYYVGDNDVYESRVFRLVNSDITSEDPLTIEGGGTQ